MSDREAAAYDINQHSHEHSSAHQAEQGYKENRILSSRWMNIFDRPVTWFREKYVEPNRKEYPWYHRQYRRVPTIDQCYTDDEICLYEANQQYHRDRMVESEILNILRNRMDDCVREEYPDFQKCFPLKEAYEEAAGNWFAKYGELGAYHDVRKAFIKQKHRLIWERRHGKVGCGMRNKDNEMSAEDQGH